MSRFFVIRKKVYQQIRGANTRDNILHCKCTHNPSAVEVTIGFVGQQFFVSDESEAAGRVRKSRRKGRGQTRLVQPARPVQKCKGVNTYVHTGPAARVNRKCAGLYERKEVRGGGPKRGLFPLRMADADRSRRDVHFRREGQGGKVLGQEAVPGGARRSSEAIVIEISLKVER
jgi:hypothetical protein